MLIARIFEYLVYLFILVYAATIVVSVLDLQFYALAFEIGAMSDQEYELAEAVYTLRNTVMYYLRIGIWLTSGITALVWIWQAYGRLYEHGYEGDLRSQRFATITFAFPVVNLWFPLRTMSELWNASHTPTDWQEHSANRLIVSWWLLWVAFNFLGATTRALSKAEMSVDTLVLMEKLAIVHAGVAIACLAFFLFLVKEITNIQQNLVAHSLEATSS